MSRLPLADKTSAATNAKIKAIKWIMHYVHLYYNPWKKFAKFIVSHNYKKLWLRMAKSSCLRPIERICQVTATKNTHNAQVSNNNNQKKTQSSQLV